VDDGDDAEGDAQPLMPEDPGGTRLSCAYKQHKDDDINKKRRQGPFP
jgi:hypothetical protein